MNITNEQLNAFVLDKLSRHGYWGGRHTAIENLRKGMPKQYAGEIKDIAKELIKEGLLLAKPTFYGVHVSLNPRMKDKINEIIDKNLPR